jgi:hypothetical protein
VINKDAFLSRNIDVHFPVELLAEVVTPYVPADGEAYVDGAPTAANWGRFLGNFAKTSIAPAGVLNIVENINVDMGGKSLSISDPDMHARIIMACTDPDHLHKSLSTCNFIPDLVSNYSDSISTTDFSVRRIDKDELMVLRNNSDVSRLNVFSGVDKYNNGNRLPAYRIEPIANSTTQFKILFDLHTIIPSSLFNSRDHTKPNIPGLDKISVRFNFNQNYNRLFSMVPYDTNTNMPHAFNVRRMTFKDTPKLSVVLYTPPTIIGSDMKDQQGNIKSYMIDYSSLEIIGRQLIPTPVTDKKYQQTFGFYNMNCAQLPKRLYIFIAPEPQSKYVTTPNTEITGIDTSVSGSCVPRNFARIDSCVLTIGNSKSLVSAKARDLYRMSVENGLKYDFDVAMYTAGYPLIVDLRKDCSLPDSIIGNTGSTSIGVDMQYTHLDSRTDRQYQLWVFAEYDQILRYENGTIDFKHSLVKANLSSLTGKDIVKSSPSTLSGGHPETYGGGVLDSVKSKFKTGVNFVVKNKDHLGNIAKAATNIAGFEMV